MVDHLIFDSESDLALNLVSAVDCVERTQPSKLLDHTGPCSSRWRHHPRLRPSHSTSSNSYSTNFILTTTERFGAALWRAAPCFNQRNAIIATHVRYLRVDPTFYPEHMDAFVFILAAVRPYLNEITFGNYEWAPKWRSFKTFPRLLQVAILEIFTAPNLRTLMLGDFYDIPFQTLACCTQLENLTVMHGGHREPTGLSSPLAGEGPERRCTLRTLGIHCDACATSILNAFDLSSLCSLDVSLSISLTTIRSLLADAHQNLNDLSWELELSDLDLANARLIDLPDVKTLCIDLSRTPDSEGHLDLIVSLLSYKGSAAPRALEVLTLVLYPTESIWGWPNFELSGLEAALPRDRYPRLKQVGLAILYHGDLEPPTRVFLEKFLAPVASLRASGILQVWCTPDSFLELR
ncbi:hypothetical protein LshimejAT787_2100160 [Lyophyllum shimeji]|uniref:Uncharacterized protein n=1 Tax=Lyophyllum shimeji TaxID=47721 RepID=A0A9P3Q227_LYOSH|nr:hypothetical protein LshimejAT787_2100160 [Lyophyllum shimeji]